MFVEIHYLQLTYILLEYILNQILNRITPEENIWGVYKSIAHYKKQRYKQYCSLKCIMATFTYI